MRRAAAQTLGVIAEVEGAGFGRRVTPLLPLLTAILRRHAAEVLYPAHLQIPSPQCCLQIPNAIRFSGIEAEAASMESPVPDGAALT